MAHWLQYWGHYPPQVHKVQIVTLASLTSLLINYYPSYQLLLNLKEVLPKNAALCFCFLKAFRNERMRMLREARLREISARQGKEKDLWQSF